MSKFLEPLYYEPLDQQRIEQLSYLIGQQIIRQGCNLVSGFGLGIGGNVLIGATEEVYRDTKAVLADRVTMRPFPQLDLSDPKRKELYSKYRHDMLSKVGCTIFLCGNKLDPSLGNSIPADGVREEFRISCELGKTPIPIGATGDIAREIWNEVVANQTKYFPHVNVNNHLQTLGDGTKTNEQFVEAIFAIIKLTSK